MFYIIKAIVFVLSHLLFRVEINGKENIPEDGPIIVAGNHVHAFDSVILLVNTKRKINYMAKVELFRHWGMRILEKPFGLIRVNRNQKDIDSMKKAIKVLKNNGAIGIFPEGTRNGMAKNIEIRPGVAYLTLKGNAKVIPVGIKGTFKLFSKVVYNIGEPLDFGEYKDNKDKELLNNITDVIMKRIIELRDK